MEAVKPKCKMIDVKFEIIWDLVHQKILVRNKTFVVRFKGMCNRLP